MALTDDLEAYFKCDEASSTFIDAHNSFDLTETSGTIPSATPLVDGTRDFEQTQTEYAIDGSGTLGKFGDEDFTVMAWFKPESTPRNPLISTLNSAETHGFELQQGSTDQAAFFVGDGSSRLGVATTGTLAAGSWGFFMGWHDSVNNLLGVRLNAEEVTTSHTTGVNSASAEALKLGLWALAGGAYADGLIGPVAIWSRMLTSGERDDLYNSGSGRPYSYINPPTGWGALLSRHRNRLIQAA